MEKEFILYEQALELKGLGFNEPCFGWFRSTLIPSNFTEFFLETEFGMNESPSDWVNSNFLDKACSAPLYQQAFRWFRKPENGSYNHLDFMYEYLKDDSITYEEAELACLNKLIEIVKNK